LLSQQLAETCQQQQQEELDLLGGDADLADLVSAKLSDLDLTAVPDLTEEAEESLMQRPGAAAAAVAPAAQEAAGTGSAVHSNGLCMLALPAADAADIGIWQLGQQDTSSSSSSSSSSKPVVLLKQQRSQERPSHGLCMAVALVQPQVRSAHVCFHLLLPVRNRCPGLALTG
jgi:hypothetical protein